MKSNSTPLHNFIWDVMLPFLSETETKFLLAVYRKTEGWGKDNDWISERMLVRMTGCSPRSLRRARVKFVDEWKIVSVKADSSGENLDTATQRQEAGLTSSNFLYSLNDALDVSREEYKVMRQFVDELFDSPWYGAGGAITQGTIALHYFFTERALPTLGQNGRGGSAKMAEGVGQNGRQQKTLDTKDKDIPPIVPQDRGTSENGEGKFPKLKELPQLGGNTTYPKPFETLWAIKPRHPNDTKGQAYQAWQKVVSCKIEPGLLQAKWSQYVASCSEPRFIKHMASWLNQRGWENEYEAKGGSNELDDSKYAHIYG